PSAGPAGSVLALDVSTCKVAARAAADDGVRRILGTLRAEGQLGRKSKRGSFLYGDQGRGTNPRLLALLADFDVGPRLGAGEDVAERVWLRLIDEYLCCITQELGEPDEIDAVLREVVGTDAGALQKIRELGPALLQPRLAALEARLGNRYEPTLSLLERMRRHDG